MSTSDRLDSEPFDYQPLKSGSVVIRCEGKPAKTLSGKEAAKFLNRIDSADAAQAQLLMAKVTGQFKFGNERPVSKAGQ